MSALDTVAVSVFRRVDRPGAKLDDLPPRTVLAEIRDGRWAAGVSRVRSAADGDARARAKRSLPFVTFSGTFRRRENKGLIEHSGLVCLDYDDLADVDASRAEVARSPHTLAAFVSPSGNGLKVCVPVACVDPLTGEARTPRDDAEHKQAFDAVAASYGLAGLDEVCRDVSRACFVSHDPGLYLNAEAVPVEVELQEAETRGEQRDSGRVASEIGETIPYGRQHATLVSFAGTMRRRGANADEIAAALLKVNERCERPGTEAAIRRIAESMMQYEPEDAEGAAIPEPGRPLGVCVADVEPEAVRWMWEGRLARGKVHLLDGDPGGGKSTIMASLAASITAGVPWPDGAAVHADARGGVVYVTAEDDIATTIRNRLDAAGADPRRVIVVGLMPTPNGAGRMPVLPLDVEALMGECARIGAKLIVLDPVTAYLGDVNSHRDADVRGALAPLAEAADRAGVAVLLIRHLNKGTGGSALYRGGGSIAFSGLARIVLLAGKVPDDPTGERRALATVKNNLSRFAPTLGYSIESAGEFAVGRVAWSGPLALTANDLVRPPATGHATPAQDAAEEFLLDALADGPRLATEMYDEAEAADVKVRTLKRAKHRLGVGVERRGGPGGSGAWYWLPPGTKGATDSTPGPLPSAHAGGTAGIASEHTASPKEATAVAPFSAVAPLEDDGPLGEAPAYALGWCVATPRGVGMVTADPEDGRVSVTVDGLPFLFALEDLTPLPSARV